MSARTEFSTKDFYSDANDSFATTEPAETEYLLMNHGTDSTTELIHRLNQDQRVIKQQTKFTVPELLEKAGGFGKAQIFSYFTVLLCNLSISFYAYNLPYLELMPQLT